MTQIKPEVTEVEQERVGAHSQTRKPYAKPAIIHELELEPRAGSPLSPPGLDIPGLEPPNK
jgi:hypothetical protein